MRLVILHMPANVNPDYAKAIATNAMEQINLLNKRVDEVPENFAETLVLPSGWSYEVVDRVDVVVEGREFRAHVESGEVLSGEA